MNFASLSSFLCFVMSFFLISEVSAADQESSRDDLKKITAEYQVKASFFALPIKAKISVERLEEGIYVASVKLKSPFFKVVQSEKARIQQCSLELLSIDSMGNRLGDKPWDEHVEIKWPEKVVSYQDEGEHFPEYQAEFLPTGFVSIFAHQYISFNKQKNQQALTYTQSKKGWRIDYQTLDAGNRITSKFFDEPVQTIRFIIPREGMKTDDMPSVWYAPEHLGSFPLLMSMKLGVFHIDVKLKSLSADEQEITRFFDDWSC